MKFVSTKTFLIITYFAFLTALVGYYKKSKELNKTNVWLKIMYGKLTPKAKMEMERDIELKNYLDGEIDKLIRPYEGFYP